MIKYLLLITILSPTSFGQTITVDHDFGSRKECREYGELIKELAWNKEITYRCKREK